MEQRRLLLFLVLTFIIFVGWYYLQMWLFPPPKPKPSTTAELSPAKIELVAQVLLARLVADPSGRLPIPADFEISQAEQADRAMAMERQRQQHLKEQLAKERTLILGGDQYKLRVLLSSTGAAVRCIELTQYQAASRLEARPLFDPNSNKPVPFRLVSDGLEADGQGAGQLSLEERWQRQSFRLLVPNTHLHWQVIEHDENHAVFESQLPAQNVRLRREFHLDRDQYHLDMRVELSRLVANQEAEITYELTGPRGVPVEGEYWKQAAYWQVVIGTTRVEDAGTSYRYLFDPTQFFPKEKAYVRPFHLDAPSSPYNVRPQALQYAGILIPYFAALTVVKGDPTRQQIIHQVLPEALGEDPKNGKRALWALPVSVRLVTRPIRVDLEPVRHDYLIYAGPAKVRLLRYEKGVRSGLPDSYEHDYHLSNLTDYPWYTFTGAIGWTALLVFCTNLMHALLEWLSWLFSWLPWRYGFSILLLTVVVRALMFPISRRQALNNLKLQQMAPELNRLKEKYKDDKQALAKAQMELYRKYGVNPFGGCLIVLLQMPVFLGLYYALYESVHLRLARFLWIENLAAPDMLLCWGNWPVISQLASFLHLGPYLHLLPIISIAVMLWQQKMFTPANLDEQQQLQMRMMNWMLVLMGWMFYWVASGLCLYFIASSLWGIVERKLLPKMLTDKESAKSSLPASERRKHSWGAHDDGQKATWRRFTRRIQEWWHALLKAAEKR